MIFANLFGFSGPDVWIVAGVVVLLFGGSKLPTFMRSLGDGMKEFKKATREMNEEPDAPAHPVQIASEPPRALDQAPTTTEPATVASSPKE